jgi:hypothetical protein
MRKDRIRQVLRNPRERAALARAGRAEEENQRAHPGHSGLHSIRSSRHSDSAKLDQMGYWIGSDWIVLCNTCLKSDRIGSDLGLD